RGVLSAGNVARSPVQALEHALVPLMFSLVDSSDRLSASAIARAAEAPTRRTSYYRSSFGVADAVCLTAVATALAACVWVVRGGWFG
ncbi:MAG: cobalt ABC transporter, partial [Eggerthella lenta]